MSIPPPISMSAAAGERRWGPETFMWIAWQRKIWMLSGLVVGLVASGAVATMLPRVYQSSAQISVTRKGIEPRPFGAEETVSPPQDLLRSPLIIDRAIQSKGLEAIATGVAEDQNLSDHIRTMLAVTPGKAPAGQSVVVYKLQYRDRDVEHCRTVLAAVIESYKEFMERRHHAVSADTLESILRDKKTLEKEMAENETAYRSFRAKAPLLGKGRDGSELRQERLTSIQTRRSALLLQKVELEGQLAALEKALKDHRSQEVILAMLAEFKRKNESAEPARPSAVQDQLFPLMMEERKLVQLHGPTHAEVVAIRNRIDVARRFLVLPPTAWKNAGETADPVQLQLELLRQRLHQIHVADESLASVLQTEQDQARLLASFEIQNDSFRSRIVMNQELYSALAKRLNEISLSRNAGGYEIELLEAPTLGRRVAPSMSLALVIGAMAGLGLGLALACRAEMRAMATLAA